MKELLMEIDKTGGSNSLYIQIYEQIRAKIQSGEIPAKTLLPSVRNLSRQLGINKITVESAYSQLMMEGYIDSAPRRGFFVRELDTEYFRKPVPQRHSVPAVSSRSYLYDFDLNRIDSEHFPMATWRKLSHECLQDNRVFVAGDPQGERELRTEIAKYVRQYRGVACDESQVIVGSNSQYLVHLVCSVLRGDGGVAAVCEPGYHLVTMVFETMGYEIAPIRVRKGALSLSDLEASWANVVFVAPSHQYPFGHIMPVQNRIELLQWAAKTDAYIIEDDYLSEFRYEGDLVPALRGLDRDERVIYMSTFQGTLLPSLRISYVILPRPLADMYHGQTLRLQQTTSSIHQQTLAEFMKHGHYERHVFRMRRVYEKKRQAMLDAIQRHFGDKVRVFGGQSGLHIGIEVDHHRDETGLLHAAEAVGVRIYPMSTHWYRPENNTFSRPAFILGYAGMSTEKIAAGIAALYQAWYQNTDVK